MPNGRPGDHPLTDMLHHGVHPFPPEIETLLREVLALDPAFPDGRRRYLDQLEWYRRFDDWQRGQRIDEGRVALTAVLYEMRSQDSNQDNTRTT
jgi:hypothetical protein